METWSSNVGRPRVDGLLLMNKDVLDQALGEELPDRLARERTVHLELLGDDGGRDEALLGHVGEELFVRNLVKEHQVRELLLHFALAPLLRAVRAGEQATVGKVDPMMGKSRTYTAERHRKFHGLSSRP